VTADSIPAGLGATCAAIRLGTPADQVGGVPPAFVAAPASTAEASAVLRAAAELDLIVVPRGTGTRLHWGEPPTRCDLVVETTRMDQVVEHAAGDLVVTVQAGVSLERLAEVLAAAGQRLALDPPALALPPAAAGPGQVAGHCDDAQVSRGTIGGVIAAGAAGPLRMRYGSPRDLLLGITVVRAEGTVARSGGKVVKNVAGYDLGKLFAGSRGTLGLITEATFRLHPIPAATRYVSADIAGPEQIGPLVGAALDAALAPVAAEIDWPEGRAGLRLAFALEGDPAAVGERAARLADLLAPAETAVGDTAPPWWAGGAAAQPGTVLQVACWPGDVGEVLAGVRAAAAEAGLDPAVGGSAGAGVLYIAVPQEADPASVARFIGGLRSGFSKLGLDGRGTGADASAVWARARNRRAGDRQAGDGRAAQRGSAANGMDAGGGSALAGHPPARATAIVLHAPPAVRALADLFGPVPSLSLMRAVKARFDPDRRMAPGRFAGGI